MSNPRHAMIKIPIDFCSHFLPQQALKRRKGNWHWEIYIKRGLSILPYVYIVRLHMESPLSLFLLSLFFFLPLCFSLSFPLSLSPSLSLFLSLYLSFSPTLSLSLSPSLSLPSFSLFPSLSPYLSLHPFLPPWDRPVEDISYLPAVDCRGELDEEFHKEWAVTALSNFHNT